jgi:hypothetical protein
LKLTFFRRDEAAEPIEFVVPSEARPSFDSNNRWTLGEIEDLRNGILSPDNFAVSAPTRPAFPRVSTPFTLSWLAAKRSGVESPGVHLRESEVYWHGSIRREPSRVSGARSRHSIADVRDLGPDLQALRWPQTFARSNGRLQ